MSDEQAIAYDINTAPEHIILNSKDMLATFGISKATLWRWIKGKKLPPPFDFVCYEARWTVGQIREWQSARAIAITEKLKNEMIKECSATTRLNHRQVSGEFDLI